jgi:hypothetical protein
VRLSFALAALVAACGGDDAGDLTVTVTFPNATAEMSTGTLHVWVVTEIVRDDPAVEAGGEAVPLVTCGRLVGGLADPYDQNVERRADAVFFMPLAGNTATVPAVPGGSAMIYVEGVDQVGRIHLAGCSEGSVPGTVMVSLIPAGVFDCANPETEDGSPCDDGMVCTVDEVCNNGRCTAGVPLNCAFVGDACHGANCVEGTGCVPVPLPEGDMCDDGLFCTVGDVCSEGVCRGTTRDCRTELGSGACEIAVCDEAFDYCDEDYAPFGTSCDDSNMCSTTSTCSSFGYCSGTNDVTCPTADACNFQEFCYSSEGCRPSPRSSDPLNCDDANACTEAYPYNGIPGRDTCSPYVSSTVRRTCMPARLKDRDNDGYVDAACDAAGGNPPDCNDNSALAYPGGTEAMGVGTTCTDGLDNNCNGLQDCADSASCGGGGCGTAGCACGTVACPSGVAPCP